MRLHKDKIESAFSHAAKTYDEHADIQKESAARLMLLLENLDPASVLELGGATGNYTIRIAERFPKTSTTSVDFSPAMIEIAKAKLSENTNVRFICKDAEALLQEMNEGYGLITSNAALQWFADLEGAIRNIKRLLLPEGVLIFSIFGPQTFKELSGALHHLYGRPVLLPSHGFENKDELMSLLNDSFSSVKLEEHTFERNYESAFQLLKHIKKTGTTGGSRPSLKLNRSMLSAMDEWFKNNYGKCTATYQLFFVTARNK